MDRALRGTATCTCSEFCTGPCGDGHLCSVLPLSKSRARYFGHWAEVPHAPTLNQIGREPIGRIGGGVGAAGLSLKYAEGP